MYVPQVVVQKEINSFRTNTDVVEIVPMRVSNWEIIGLSLKTLNN